MDMLADLGLQRFGGAAAGASWRGDCEAANGTAGIDGTVLRAPRTCTTP